MRFLTAEQVSALVAFMDAFDLYAAEWVAIERSMRRDFGIDDPEAALADAMRALDPGRA